MITLSDRYYFSDNILIFEIKYPSNRILNINLIAIKKISINKIPCTRLYFICYYLLAIYRDVLFNENM